MNFAADIYCYADIIIVQACIITIIITIIVYQLWIVMCMYFCYFE